jgi:hypothetical protein
MLKNRGEIVQGIIIGLCVFLSSSVLIITLYLLYLCRRKSISFDQNPIINNQNEELKKDKSNLIEIEQRNVPLTNQIRSNSIEELMRKSLQLAKTAEKVADEKEKRINLKDKTQIDLQF